MFSWGRNGLSAVEEERGETLQKGKEEVVKTNQGFFSLPNRGGGGGQLKTDIQYSGQTQTTFSFTDPRRNIYTRIISAGYVLQPCGTGLDSSRED